MISKSREKFVKSLQLGKYRKLHGQFIAERPKIVLELFQSRFIVNSVFATEEFLNKNMSAIPSDCSIHSVTGHELKKISTLRSPQEVLAVVEIPTEGEIDHFQNEDLTLVLDDIRDPGNMGTIVRTADWFGVRNIICSEDSVDIYNPKVVQATMGSLARVRISYISLREFLSNVPAGIPVYGCLMEGTSLYEAGLSPKAYIVIGNEAHGISNELLPVLTERLSIPSYGKDGKGAESLNAAIASAVVLSEFRRLFPGPV